MVWLTVGAVVVGVVVVLFASGAVGGTNKPTAVIVPPATSKAADLVDPADPRALGGANAPIKLEVWADFQCPACALYATEIEPSIVDEYVASGKAHIKFHDYAFLDSRSTTKESQDAAAAARCAAEQGQFWAYHDWLFANQRGENKGAFSRDRLKTIAERVGLDVNAWQSCLDAGEAHAAVAAETKQGADQTVNSTPTLVINGEIQRDAKGNAGALPLDQLRAKFDAILAGETPSPAPSGSPVASATPAASTTPAP
jgi:protein-disulfide isomerase